MNTASFEMSHGGINTGAHQEQKIQKQGVSILELNLKSVINLLVPLQN